MVQIPLRSGHLSRLCLRFDPQGIQTAHGLTRIRLLRALFTLTTLAVVWLVASPALAANVPGMHASMRAPPDPFGKAATSVPASSRAPLCDPRGATTFAPPPQVQDVERSLDTGLTLDDCMTTTSRGARRAVPGRTPLPTGASASSDSASDRLILAVAVLAAAARELLPVPAVSTSCARPGVRSTVDRPQRA